MFSGDPKALAWLKAHLDTAGTDILSICTGIFVCGAAGLLQGKKACGPRNLQGMLAETFKSQDVTWVGEEMRWMQDGNFWSCGMSLLPSLFFSAPLVSSFFSSLGY